MKKTTELRKNNGMKRLLQTTPEILQLLINQDEYYKLSNKHNIVFVYYHNLINREISFHVNFVSMNLIINVSAAARRYNLWLSLIEFNFYDKLFKTRKKI